MNGGIYKKIRRNEQIIDSVNLQDDLMNTFENDRNTIYAKLKKYRGENLKNNDIPFIETL